MASSIIETRPQKRTIRVVPYILGKGCSAPTVLKFHLYFPSFKFELRDGSFFAYAELPMCKYDILSEFHLDRKIDGHTYVLPFHENWYIHDRRMCLSKKRYPYFSGLKEHINLFWQSDFEKDTRYLGCLKQWQKHQKISWVGIFNIFAARWAVLKGRGKK